MIEVGKKYCPVCVANNGLGDDPASLSTRSTLGKTIQPCRYPWQTPIGVLLQEPRQVGSVKPAEIKIRGTFELYWNNDPSEPPEDTPDIYGCDQFTSLIGVRVYYDAKNGIYVTDFATNTRKADEPFYWGNYPGAATIGYISAVRVDGNLNAGWVTITIDPRPARASYRVCSFYVESEDSPLPAVGMPVKITSPGNYAYAFTSSDTTCDGVIAGVIDQYADDKYQVIVCTSGPAWIFPTQAQLYHIYESYELSDYTPENVPITATLAFCPIMQEEEASAPPRIGFAHLKQWYVFTLSSTPYEMIIDVNPGSLTPNT